MPRGRQTAQGHGQWYGGTLDCFRAAFEKLEQELLGMWKELGDERHMTGYLIGGIMRQSFGERLNKCIGGEGASVVLTWKSDRSETSTGADIGAIIDIDLPNKHEEKAILLQAKRFDEAKGRYRSVKKKQADDMVRITPASFYIFYHPRGFRVSSASNVSSILPEDRDSMDLRPQHLARVYQRRFSSFMVNDFMKTHVGDARPYIVRGIRDGNLAEYSLEMIVRFGESATH